MKKYILLVIIGTLIISGFGAGALNVNNEKIVSNEDPRDYTHTVLVEAGLRKGCPQCPATNTAWKSIYAGGNYDFEFVGLIYQKNPKALQRFNSFNPRYVPTSYFDGGQYVCVGTNYNTFYNYLDSSGSRTVPDLVGEVNAMWLGNAKIDISISVENNDNNDYPGTLRVYVVEIVSRWTDYNNQPYGHALLDFPWNQAIDIDSGDTFEDSKVWDGAAAGYADIDPDNIQVILAVFDDTPYTSYSDPPSGYPFNAYYADETVAALVYVPPPPDKPTITGPTTGDPLVEYEYTFVATHPDGEDLDYWIDWGDGTTDGWLGTFESGEEIIVPHTFDEAGIFEITAKARDIIGGEGEWSDPYEVMMGNIAPSVPLISGPSTGQAGTAYDFTFTSEDPNGDDVQYYIKWGNGDTTPWTTLQASGTPYAKSHTWDDKGTFTIEAKAKDEHGAESDWESFEIVITKSRVLQNTFIYRLLEQFKTRFPMLNYLLRI